MARYNRYMDWVEEGVSTRGVSRWLATNLTSGFKNRELAFLHRAKRMAVSVLSRCNQESGRVEALH